MLCAKFERKCKHVTERMTPDKSRSEKLTYFKSFHIRRANKQNTKKIKFAKLGLFLKGLIKYRL